MVQFKAISRLQTPEQMMDVFRKNTGTFQKEVLKDLAAVVVSLSPVDTATYVNSHSVGEGGRDRGFPGAGRTTSAGKPRNQNAEAARGAALASLTAQIDQMGDDIQNPMLRNASEHAWRVEYGGWGEGTQNRAVGRDRLTEEMQAELGKQPYFVYTKARAQIPAIIADVKVRLGLE